jgi:alcohol dehydrogenase class IV
MALPGETYRLAFPTLKGLENPAYVSYGRPHHEACAHHVKNTYNAKRAYIIASTSLSKNTDEIDKLKTALGDRVVGVWPGISPHTPWDEVVAATKDALQKQADCLITIGGGSLVDGAKCMLLFMANNITTVPEVLEFGSKLKYSVETMHRTSAEIDCSPPMIPLIGIPTTLSGGEYTYFGGGTDPETHFKMVMCHPLCGPSLVINDPKLTITTPEWVCRSLKD